MSLLIMIALVAILGIFAVVLLRALLREIDVEVAQQEVATLKSYHQALQSAILREGYIPAYTDWADIVATNSGVQTLDVSVNKRHQARVLLVDTNSTIPFPYTQDNQGALVQPANARMMIVSSLGQALPMSNGALLNTTNFAALWNATEGTANFPSWAGRSEDVKIQRLDLTPSFVRVYVTTQPALPVGYYAFGTSTASNAAPLDPYPPARYVLQGTVLRLYNADGTLDSTQVMNRRGSFKYENGVWKGDPSGAVMPGGVDLAAVVKAFLEAVPNMNSQAAKDGANPADQQKRIVTAMMDYMRNYNTWADSGFPNNALYQYLVNDSQPNMRIAVQQIFLKGGNPNYYPQNTVTPCP